MSLPTSTKQWVLVKNASKDIILDGPDATFKLVDTPLPQLKDGEILVQTLYMSNDPAQRVWIWHDMPAERMYTEPVKQGEVMKITHAICKVLDSKADNIKTGSLVAASPGWSQYAVLGAKTARPIQELPNLSIIHYLGGLGGVGLTAYGGLTEIGNVTSADTVLVSGAAGGTGSMVVGLAKHMFQCARVVGIAGSDDKCRWVESLGADACVNYKSATFEQDLERATPRRVSLFFDNVAGPVLDVALTRMARFGRVVACGAISDYNRRDDAARPGIRNWFDVVSNRLEIRGFIVSDAGMDKLREWVGLLIKAATEGKVKLDDGHLTVVEAKFEDVPRAFTKLFEGANQGKLITKVV